MGQHGRMGFRFIDGIERPDGDLVGRLGRVPTADLADAMGRFGFMDPGMARRNEHPLFGVAVTVNLRPGDNLMVHKAIALAQPEDVLVIATNGGRESAVVGELVCRAAVAKGITGIVVDGAVRDVEAIARLDLGVYSRWVVPGAGDREGPGEVNVPVSCGGVAVLPGDVVVGDADGVVVVPRRDAAAVLAQALELPAKESRRRAAIEAGEIVEASVDELLRARGVLGDGPPVG